VILILIALVTTFGPSDPASAQAFAERLGRWVGPIGGALYSFLAAFCVARPLTSGRKTNCVAAGVFLAVLDVVLLVASHAPFQWLFVVSNLGKILAGYIGGVATFRFGKNTQKSACRQVALRIFTLPVRNFPQRNRTSHCQARIFARHAHCPQEEQEGVAGTCDAKINEKSNENIVGC
jgi:hypothetical protein